MSDFFVVQPQDLAEDVIVGLAQHWGRSFGAGFHAGEFPPTAQVLLLPQPGFRWMLDSLKEPPGAKVGVAEQLAGVQHGTGGHSLCLQCFHHLIRGALGCPVGDYGVQCFLVPIPDHRVNKPGVTGQGWLLYGLAK